MSMIDIGVVIEVSTTAQASNAAFVKPTTWLTLRECLSIPQLLAPPARIATDYVGDDTIGEILGKKSSQGLDLQFGYDGSGENNIYGQLFDLDAAGGNHFMRVTLPDGLKMELLTPIKVNINDITPSAEITYTLSLTAKDVLKEGITGAPAAIQNKLVTITKAGDTDPLA
jgi:hypothetical protein